MPRSYQSYNRGYGNDGFTFGGFGVPFLGGLAGGLLGNALFPGYGGYGGYGGFGGGYGGGGYGYGYGNYPFYGGSPYMYPYPYSFYPYDLYRPF